MWQTQKWVSKRSIFHRYWVSQDCFSESSVFLVHFMMPIHPRQSFHIRQHEFSAVASVQLAACQATWCQSQASSSSIAKSPWKKQKVNFPGSLVTVKNKAITFSILIKAITLKIVGQWGAKYSRITKIHD